MTMRRKKQTFVEYCRDSCDMACIELVQDRILAHYNTDSCSMLDVKRDTDSLYRALSASMHDTPELYQQLRSSIYKELKSHFAHYESVFQKFVNTDVTRATEQDAKQIFEQNPTWGDSVVALIAANALSRPIAIVTVATNGTQVNVTSFVPEGHSNCVLDRFLILELHGQHYRAIRIHEADGVVTPQSTVHQPIASGHLLGACGSSQDCDTSMGYFCDNGLCINDIILATLPSVSEPTKKPLKIQLPSNSRRLSLGALQRCQNSSQCDADLGLFCDRGMCVNDRIYNQVIQENYVEDS